MSKTKIGIIIQARLGSSRLPNKMLLPFYKDKGVFELLIEKLTSANLGIPIILATTTKDSDLPLVSIAKKLGIQVYKGSENNVLSRFIEAALQFKLNKVIRICADNPFLDIDALEEIHTRLVSSEDDYVAYCTSSGLPTIKTHYGYWTEGVTLNALIKIKESTKEPIYLEHVTNYIYSHKEHFSLNFKTIDKVIEKYNVRCTLDTESDYVLLKEIYSIVESRKMTTLELVKYIASNKNWMYRMKLEISKNEK